MYKLLLILVGLFSIAQLLLYLTLTAEILARYQVEWIVRIVRDTGWFCWMSVVPGYGFFLMMTRGIKASYKYLLPGVFIFVISIGNSISVLKFSKLADPFLTPSEHITSIESALKDDVLTPERRFRASYILARTRYREMGMLTYYVTEDGQGRLFRPTSKDVKFYQTVLSAKQQFESLRRGSVRSLYLATSIFILSLLFASICAVFQLRKTYPGCGSY